MKCLDCKRATKEFLVTSGAEKKFLFLKWKGDRSLPLCRHHLIEHFKEAFVSAKQKMVVFCPNLEGKQGSYQYFYSTRETLKKYAPDPKINDSILFLMGKWMEAIMGKCQECSSDARAAYFDKYSLPYERVPGYLGGLFNYPMIHKVTDKPRILCPACAFKEMEFTLRMAQESFGDGIFTPKEDEEGIYVAVEM